VKKGVTETLRKRMRLGVPGCFKLIEGVLGGGRKKNTGE